MIEQLTNNKLYFKIKCSIKKVFWYYVYGNIVIFDTPFMTAHG